MATLEEILSGRRRLLDDAAQTFSQDIEGVLAELALALDRLLSGLDRSGGRLERSTDAIDRAVALFPELVEALRDAGYRDAAESYVGHYGDVVEAVRATFGAVGVDAPFVAVHREAADRARELHLAFFEDIGERAARDIQLSIRQAVLVERDYTSFVEELRASITGNDVRGSALANRANTFAGTAIGQFDALVTEMVADEAGVTHFTYWGPADGVTRPWCSARLAHNEPITREEIDRLPLAKSNSTGSGSWTGRGGWNCRHVWSPAVGGPRA